MAAPDIYPRDGETYTASFKKETKPKKNPLANRNTIQEDMVNWLQQSIDFAGNIDNIQVDKVPNGIDRQVTIEAQVLAHKMLRDLLISKQVEFKQYLEEK